MATEIVTIIGIQQSQRQKTVKPRGGNQHSYTHVHIIGNR